MGAAASLFSEMGERSIVVEGCVVKRDRRVPDKVVVATNASKCFLLNPRPGQPPAMVADKHEVPAVTIQARKIAIKNDLTKWMNRFQSVGINKDLLHIRSIGLQRIDQFMGGGAVEIPVEGEVDTISVFMLENLEVHGHRLPSFPPPGGGTFRLTEKDFSIGRRCVTPEVVKRREAQRRQFYFRSATFDSTVSTGTPIHVQDAASHETYQQ